LIIWQVFPPHCYTTWYFAGNFILPVKQLTDLVGISNQKAPRSLVIWQRFATHCYTTCYFSGNFLLIVKQFKLVRILLYNISKQFGLPSVFGGDFFPTATQLGILVGIFSSLQNSLNL
jgi:uncharacterized protein YqgC (DUF456 family)